MLAQLTTLKARLGLDSFIIPHEDEHQNEYLPDANERLAWVSGFTGSAGAAIVFQDRAILFAEGMIGRSALNWQVGNAKFFSPVGPDETLTFSLTPKPSGAIAFTVRAADRDVAAGSLTPPAP